MTSTRWKQRFENYKSALKQLESAVALSKTRELSELEQQGLIQAFEFTHELAWNVMKDYFYYQGNSSITGSRDATREAFKQGLIQDGDSWMAMIESRNLTTHTYQEKIADQISKKICGTYFQLFSEFQKTMNLKVDEKN